MRKTRAYTDIDQIREQIISAVLFFRPHCVEIDVARWADVETFVAVALRVMEKSNPSKVRDAAMVEEIKARMDKREVIE